MLTSHLKTFGSHSRVVSKRDLSVDLSPPTISPDNFSVVPLGQENHIWNFPFTYQRHQPIGTSWAARCHIKMRNFRTWEHVEGLRLQLIEHFVSSVMISSWNNASCDFFVALFNLLGLLSLKSLIVASLIVTIQILRSSCQWSSDHLILTSGSFRGIHIAYPTILNSSLTTEYNVPLFRNNYCLGDPVITYFHSLVTTQEPLKRWLEFPYRVTCH